MRTKPAILLFFTLLLFLLLTSACGQQTAEQTTAEPPQTTTAAEPMQAEADAQEAHLLIKGYNWSDDVKGALNGLLMAYGADGETPAETPYAIFDFDDLSAVFDAEKQLAAYQLRVMAFAVAPEDLKGVLLTDQNDADRELADRVDDICAAYAALWRTYGPFTAGGLDAEEQKAVQADPQWQAFAEGMRALYAQTDDAQPSDAAHSRGACWTTGMTEDEIYALAMAGFDNYTDADVSAAKCVSPKNMSAVGAANHEWTSGTQVLENVRDLWRALDDNGIDVWGYSAGGPGAIRAAIDSFGLHDACAGVIAVTNQTDADSRYIAERDPEAGCGFYANDDGSWTRMTRAVKAQTPGVGKATATANAIAPEYGGHGPIAGFMDTADDLSFCTAFESLKLVISFDRANSGGLIAKVAVIRRIPSEMLNKGQLTQIGCKCCQRKK